jgi:microcin C transport system permease protein
MNTAVNPAQTVPAKKPFLSPISQRRWSNFKANRRGYWSLWIFGVLFILTLFAEFVALDRIL